MTRFRTGALAAILAMATLPFLAVPLARATVAFSVRTDFPTPVTVGQTGVPATMTIVNASDGVQASGTVTVGQIALVPSCGNLDPNCTGNGDPGTFAVSGSAAGSAAVTDACTGKTFTVVVVNTATGQVQFQPTGGPVVLEAPSAANALDTCTIDFTLDVRKSPNNDVSASGGIQTHQVSLAEGTHQGGTFGVGTGTGVTTVRRGMASMVTRATPSAARGAPISDMASVTGPVISPAPTGTVSFSVFGPDDAACTGAAAFTSGVRPLSGGPPTATATSGPFRPATSGTYRWTASYSGDRNYVPVATACNDANESSLVKLTPTLTTHATPSAPVARCCQPVHILDTASVTGVAGGPAPTGTVTFTLHGSNDANCTGPPIFTSGGRPLSGGPPTATAVSEPFTPSEQGIHRWVAAYSGDAAYVAVVGACNDPNESSVIGPPTVALSLFAVDDFPLGGGTVSAYAIADAPTVGSPLATGTVTFSLYGPNDPTCSGPVRATSAKEVEPDPNLPGQSSSQPSDPYTPLAAGTYHWAFAYGGDPIYAPVAAVCDQSATVEVTKANVTIVNRATPEAVVGQPIRDSVSVTAPAGLPAPTGQVVILAFAPDALHCLADPVSEGEFPLAGGPPTATARSSSYTPTTPGVYRWVYAYLGDSNYNGGGGGCNEAGATSLVKALSCTITGAGAIVGTAGDDVICGSGGRDSIVGLGGNDTLVGMGGDDVLVGGPGDDVLLGGDGDDVLGAAGGRDGLSGGAGDDRLVTADGAADDEADGGPHTSGDLCVVDPFATAVDCENPRTPRPTTTTSPSTTSTTTVVGGPTCDGRPATRVGSAGNDVIFGTPGDDVIVGLGGNDVIDGSGGHDRICGGDGNDVLRGGAGNDRVFGGNGDDVLDGGEGADALFG